MLNKAIISRPINWFVIGSFLLIGWYVFHLAASYHNSEMP